MVIINTRVELLVRVSELYYEENLSQQEISKIMNISRPTISRLLDEAKSSGVVEIIVHSPIEKNPSLSQQIRTKFNLRDAIVVSGDYDYEKALERCSQVASKYLHTILENNHTLGISWGLAMRYFATSLEPVNYYNVNVVQMVGCLGSGNPRYDGLELALEISKKLDANYANIYAPIYIDSKVVYDYLMNEPQIHTAIKKACTSNIIVTGIGSFESSNSSLQIAGYYDEQERLKYIETGAVSHIIGRVLDKDGKEMPIENRYVISSPLSAIHDADWSIGICASKSKAPAVLSVLRGKHINMLVIDEALALELLA